MKKFRVSVEKKMYATGTVEVLSACMDDAIDNVRVRILAGEIQTTDVDWNDPQYEDCSFDVTGDVEEV